jgi:hypothetical protein
LIEEQKFLINTTDAGDESQLVYVCELRDHHSRLAAAPFELNQAEKSIIEKAQDNMETETSDDVNDFLKEAMNRKESRNHQQQGQQHATPKPPLPTVRTQPWSSI